MLIKSSRIEFSNGFLSWVNVCKSNCAVTVKWFLKNKNFPIINGGESLRLIPVPALLSHFQILNHKASEKLKALFILHTIVIVFQIWSLGLIVQWLLWWNWVYFFEWGVCIQYICLVAVRFMCYYHDMKRVKRK